MLDLSKLKDPGGTRKTSDATRLAVMVILALIVVAAILYFDNVARFQKSKAKFDPEDHLGAPRRITVPNAKVEPEKLSEVRDKEIAERVVKEKEPYLHLIKQASRLVYGDMELLGIQRPVPEEILKNPAACRGKPYEIKGTLEWHERITDLDFELYRGYITTPEEDYYYFTVREMPAYLSLGDVVKLQGFFFKIYSFNLLEEDRRINDGIFLIGKRMIPSFFQLPPTYALDADLMDTLYDYDEQDMIKPFEEKPLYHILSYVHNMSEDTSELMAYEEHLPVEILNASNQYRGAPVKVLGELVWLQERNLGPEGENPVGPKTVFHGLLINWRGGFCYFLTFDRPEWLNVSKDLIYATGFFFRNYAYRTRGGEIKAAPVVIANGFEKFILPEDNSVLYISYAILAGTALVTLFFFLHVFRDRRQSERYREKFIERKKKLLTRLMDASVEGKETEPPSPGGDAEPHS